MACLKLSACDLLFSNDIQCERDDGHVHSWIDHILCTQSFSCLVSDAQTLRSCSNLSEHSVSNFTLTVRLPLPPTTPSSISITFCGLKCQRPIGNYQDLVCQHLPKLSSDIIACAEIKCSYHSKLLEEYVTRYEKTCEKSVY